MNKDTYPIGMFITGVVAFVGVWIYAISEWGLLLGLIFGWIPALIAGFVLGVLWPVVAVAVIIIVIYLSANEAKTSAFNKRVEECVKAQQAFNPYREELTDTRTQGALEKGWSVENIQKGIAADKLRNSKWLEEARRKCQTQVQSNE